MKTKMIYTSFIVLAAFLLPLSNPLQAQNSLALSSATVAPGGSTALDLSLSSSSTPPAGVQWTFGYPATSLGSFNVTAGPALSSAGKTLSCAGGGGSYTCVAWGLNSNSISNGVVATVSVTLAGSSDVPITVDSSLGASPAGDTIAVTGTGGTVTVAAALTISSLACSPTALAPNASSTCTVNLSGPGGGTIGLSSSSTNLTVPASLTIPTNASSGTFLATAKAFTTDQSAVVTATFNGSSKPVTLSLTAPPVTLSNLQCAATTLASNASTTCTVTLFGSSTSITVVALSNSAPSVLTVPSSVSVPANATTATFTASTGALLSDQTATVTASLNGSSKLVTLSLVAPPITLSNFQCAATTLASNASTTCTVTLSGSSTGITVVALSNSAPSVLTVPSSVSVPANATTATFTASTGALLSDQTATVTASLNGSSKPVNLSLTAPPVTLSNLQCAATTLASNASTSCTVTLTKSATSITAVALSSSAPSVLTVPSSVSVPANATTATFTASTGALLSDQTATVTASLNGSSKLVALSLTAPPFTLSNLQCAPTTLASGASTTCTVTLSGSSTSITVVALSNSSSSALTVPSSSVLTVPSSVSVPANATSATFTASTGALLSDQSATVTATLNGSSKFVTLSLVAPQITLSNLTCAAATLASNASTTCTVTLSSSSTGITAVALSSSAPSVLTVPASVSVPANATTANFTASTGAVLSDQTATVTASLNGSSKPVTLSLVAPAITLSNLQCAATTLASNASTTCTVTLTRSATSITAVALSSSAPSVLTVPASVSVPANATTANFTASTGAVLSDQTATVTASLNGSSKPVTLSLVAPAITLSNLQCAATTLASNASTTCTVTLSSANTSPTMVTLSNTASSALTVPSAVSVSANATTANFTVSTGALLSDQTATVTAWLNSSSKPVTISLVAAPITLSTIQCAAATLASNASTTCTVTLSKVAPAGGVTVSISSSVPSLLLIAQGTVTVPAGAPSATFTASAATITTPQDAVITATLGSARSIANISLIVAASAKPLSLSCTPAVLTPGISGSCLVSLGVPASTPTIIKLKATNTAFTIANTVKIGAGDTSATVQFTTSSSLAGWVILMATSGNGSQTFTFTVAARTSDAVTNLMSLSCDKHITAGLTGVCELRLSPSSSSETAAIALTSSSSRLKIPETLFAGSGQATIRFQVAADPESTEEGAILEARSGDSVVRDTLAVASSGPKLLAPDRIAGMPATALRFRVSATRAVSISAAGLPQGSTFDASTGAFEWVPPAAGLGEYEISFTATDARGSRTAKSVAVYVGTGAPVVTQLRNIAGGAVCSPGAIAAISGWFLSNVDAPLTDRSGLSASLGETRVLVNGTYAPILSTSADQVEFLCPALPAGTPLHIAAETPSGQSGFLQTIMEESAPAVFTADGTPQGQALATRSNSIELAALPNFRMRANPAQFGERISIWATGIECATSQRLWLNVGGQTVAVDSAQPVPQMAGVCEIAFRIPANVAGDSVALTIATMRSDALVSSSNLTSVAVRDSSTETNSNSNSSSLHLEEKQ